MHYTVYKIMNNVNNMEYIGIHQTKDLDDGYMGSGKYIKRAIEKHGIENFSKEILFIFNNEDEMRNKEKQLVTESYCQRKDTYNLCVGGGYGFSYIHRMGLAHNKEVYKKISDTAKRKGIRPSESAKQAVLMAHKEGKYNYATFTDKKHTEETKLKMSESKKGMGVGKQNSQFGTMWITNGTENKKIKKIDSIPEGWCRGRRNL